MPPRKNLRHEIFAQEVAKGVSAATSYARAGYRAKGNSAQVNACRLLRNAKVRGRVAELQAEAAVQAKSHIAITVDSLTAMLFEDRKLAHETHQPSAAVTASVHVGRLHGFSFEKIKGTAAERGDGPPSSPGGGENIVNFLEMQKTYGDKG